MITIIKKVTVLLILLIIAALLTAEATLGDNYRFLPSPSYTTANKWAFSDGKTAKLNNLKTNKPVTVRLKVNKRFQKGTYLIIKKENLKITAFTKNKVLYKTDEGKGKAYALLPVEEVLKGEDISLLLEPEGKAEGSILGTVKLQSKNDFFFTLLYENRKCLLAVLLLFAFLCAAIGSKRIYAALAIISLILIIVTRAEFYQFFFGIHGIARAVNRASFLSFAYFTFNYIIIAIKGIIWYNK